VNIWIHQLELGLILRYLFGIFLDNRFNDIGHKVFNWEWHWKRGVKIHLNSIHISWTYIKVRLEYVKKIIFNKSAFLASKEEKLQSNFFIGELSLLQYHTYIESTLWVDCAHVYWIKPITGRQSEIKTKYKNIKINLWF